VRLSKPAQTEQTAAAEPAHEPAQPAQAAAPQADAPASEPAQDEPAQGDQATGEAMRKAIAALKTMKPTADSDQLRSFTGAALTARFDTDVDHATAQQWNQLAAEWAGLVPAGAQA
jgi:hypothetical protein